MMEAVSTSKSYVCFCQPTPRIIPEDSSPPAGEKCVVLAAIIVQLCLGVSCSLVRTCREFVLAC
jgi:hypothetical protein